jgi:glycosyltransferase involved in cell wall biosynthesis
MRIEKVETKKEQDNTISACIIARDEADNIGNCILSIITFVDEIILVDTGSKDNTIEQVKMVGGDKVKVYKQKWKNDFSFHRNYAMSKATMEWILTIDADEYVVAPDGDTLKMLLRDVTANIIGVDLRNVFGPEKKIKNQFLSLRLFRRSYGPKYQDKLHNKPVIKAGETVYKIPFKINHTGYDLEYKDMIKKYERRVRMSKLNTEENPDSPEAWYDYARSLKSKDGVSLNDDDVDELLMALNKCLEIIRKEEEYDHVYIEACNLMAMVAFAQGKHQKAVKYAKQVLAYKPDHLDAIFIIANAFTYGINALEGERWFKKYLEEQEKYPFSELLDKISMEYGHERIGAYQALIQIEKWKRGDTKEAINADTKKERRKAG